MTSERRFPTRRDVIFVLAVAYLGANALVPLPTSAAPDALVINIVVRGSCWTAITWFV